MNSTAPYTVADAQQRSNARESAEALFAPKPPPGNQAAEAKLPAKSGQKRRVLSATMPTAKNAGASGETGPSLTPERKPRVLRAIMPADKKVQPGAPTKPGIPSSEVARVRSWIKYGMELHDIAGMYGITVDDLRQVLRER